MKTGITLALATALVSTASAADTLITNANGMQVDANGALQHFTGLLVGDDGMTMTAGMPRRLA